MWDWVKEGKQLSGFKGEIRVVENGVCEWGEILCESGV